MGNGVAILERPCQSSRPNHAQRPASCCPHKVLGTESISPPCWLQSTYWSRQVSNVGRSVVPSERRQLQGEGRSNAVGPQSTCYCTNPTPINVMEADFLTSCSWLPGNQELMALLSTIHSKGASLANDNHPHGDPWMDRAQLESPL